MLADPWGFFKDDDSANWRTDRVFRSIVLFFSLAVPNERGRERGTLCWMENGRRKGSVRQSGGKASERPTVQERDEPKGLVWAMNERAAGRAVGQVERERREMSVASPSPSPR